MVGWIFFGIYILVLFLVLADLWSGIRKARQRGELRTSYGFRKTVDKIAKYYNALIAFSVVDAMQIGSILYMNNYYDKDWFLFPVVTLIGAVGIGLIEIKSILEKSDAKVKNEYKQVASLAMEIAKHKDDPQEIANKIINYLKGEKNEDKSNLFGEN